MLLLNEFLWLIENKLFSMFESWEQEPQLNILNDENIRLQERLSNKRLSPWSFQAVNNVMNG